MTDDAVPESETPTEGRRNLLKKALVFGGVAWVAPVVVSHPAFAQGSAPPPPPECTNIFLGNPIYPCGGIQLLHPGPPNVWVITSFPTGQGSSAPVITDLFVTGGIASNVNGLGSTTVTLNVDSEVTPSFCITYRCP